MEGFPKDVVILGRSLWHLTLSIVWKSLNFTWWVVVGVFIQFSLWSGHRSANWDWKQRRLCKTHASYFETTHWLEDSTSANPIWNRYVGPFFGSCVRCQDLLHGLIGRGSSINLVSTVFCIQCGCISHLRVIKIICHHPWLIEWNVSYSLGTWQRWERFSGFQSLQGRNSKWDGCGIV